MSINPIGIVPPGAGVVPGSLRPAQGEEASTEQLRTPARTPGHGTEAHAGSGVNLPERTPSGTDPDLWSVLTSEERDFFARARAMGPLTYGPSAGGAGPNAPARGGRVDLRV